MNIEFMQVVFAIGLVLVIAAILNKLSISPARIVFRAGYSLVFGMILIWAFNYVGGIFGLYIPANIVTILTAGILGLPGLGLMVVIQLIV